MKKLDLCAIFWLNSNREILIFNFLALDCLLFYFFL